MRKIFAYIECELLCLNWSVVYVYVYNIFMSVRVCACVCWLLSFSSSSAAFIFLVFCLSFFLNRLRRRHWWFLSSSSPSSSMQFVVVFAVAVVVVLVASFFSSLVVFTIWSALLFCLNTLLSPPLCYIRRGAHTIKRINFCLQSPKIGVYQNLFHFLR